VRSNGGSGDGNPEGPEGRPAPQGRGLEVVDRQGLQARIDEGLALPPIGVLLIEWDAVPGPTVESTRPAAQDPIVGAVLAEAGPADTVVSTGPGQLGLVRRALTAPAEAESQAHRIAARFRAAGDRPDAPAPTWAIGVAVSHRSDTAADLLRYAEHALTDAQLLGGDRVVPFEDADRLLLDAGADADPPDER